MRGRKMREEGHRWWGEGGGVRKDGEGVRDEHRERKSKRTR